MTAMVEATDKVFVEVRKELDKVKLNVKAIEEAKEAPRTVNAPRAMSVGARSAFRPTKVFVQGFYDFDTDKGALRDTERDQWGQTLLSHLPAHLAEQFQLEKKYAITRRLVFTTKGQGGEVCWEVREKFMDAISVNNYKINSRDLKVRVEEDENRANRRKCYWRAVDALRTMKTEKVDFLLEPATFGI